MDTIGANEGKQQNKAGFIFLLAGIPIQLLQLADIFNEAGFNLVNTIHELSKRKNLPKVRLFLNRVNRILNQRNSCKQLFNGHREKIIFS